MCRSIAITKIPLPGYNIAGNRNTQIRKLYGRWHTAHHFIGNKASLRGGIYGDIVCLGNAIGAIGIAYHQGNAINSRCGERYRRILQVGKVAATKIPVPKTRIAGREVFKGNSKWCTARYGIGAEISYRRLCLRPLSYSIQ